jgi:hypothetical protein
VAIQVGVPISWVAQIQSRKISILYRSDCLLTFFGEPSTFVHLHIEFCSLIACFTRAKNSAHGHWPFVLFARNFQLILSQSQESFVPSSLGTKSYLIKILRHALHVLKGIGK